MACDLPRLGSLTRTSWTKPGHKVCASSERMKHTCLESYSPSHPMVAVQVLTTGVVSEGSSVERGPELLGTARSRHKPCLEEPTRRPGVKYFLHIKGLGKQVLMSKSQNHKDIRQHPS